MRTRSWPAYAIVMGVKFQIGAGFSVPTQIVLVPMLFLLPVETVPLAGVAGSIAGTLPGVLAGRVPRDRILVAVATGAFAIGPALVFALGDARGAEWILCCAAFAAQVVTDFAASAIREWLCSDVPPSFQAKVMGLVALVDALLWPIGLLAAMAAQRHLAPSLNSNMCSMFNAWIGKCWQGWRPVTADEPSRWR